MLKYFVAKDSARSVIQVRLGKRTSRPYGGSGLCETVEGIVKGGWVYAKFSDGTKYKISVSKFYGKDWIWLGRVDPHTGRMPTRDATPKAKVEDLKSKKYDKRRKYTLEELFEMDDA